METIVNKDTITSIKKSIEAILDNKIQIKENMNNDYKILHPCSLENE